jgi:glutaredoxin
MKKNYSIYVKTDCPFCKKAVMSLQQTNLPFIVIVVDNNHEYLEAVKQQTSHKTVPIVLEHTEAGARLIGGSDDLESYLNSPEFSND